MKRSLLVKPADVDWGDEPLKISIHRVVPRSALRYRVVPIAKLQCPSCGEKLYVLDKPLPKMPRVISRENELGGPQQYSADVMGSLIDRIVAELRASLHDFIVVPLDVIEHLFDVPPSQIEELYKRGKSGFGRIVGGPGHGQICAIIATPPILEEL